MCVCVLGVVCVLARVCECVSMCVCVWLRVSDGVCVCVSVCLCRLGGGGVGVPSCPPWKGGTSVDGGGEAGQNCAHCTQKSEQTIFNHLHQNFIMYIGM